MNKLMVFIIILYSGVVFHKLFDSSLQIHIILIIQGSFNSPVFVDIDSDGDLDSLWTWNRETSYYK